ncbi:aldo/keto reductase [Agreia sp. VKM Ac-1783]|uniref:aldo/keto reductase n=1 Tax=Agreia sp. VKM Ac-1783 TaxID=1938889 RepID=UPI000A2AE82E|nr:aldo/keto reductase [Agreia sp. VKM Ac-1783]SMQ68519.1 2,5-diketo-D-gluconate reductase A [Agreia sp. VKM Ac-1783]
MTNSESSVPLVTLNDGNTIPQLGFGVFKVDPDKTSRIVRDAFEVGYRHIDTAKIYGNEEGVGHAIKTSGIDRDELFITTKLWNADQGYESGLEAFEKSLGRLQLDYVDLYLIHWPAPANDNYVDAWKALEKIRESGRAKSIGVSNFTVEHLTRLLGETDVVPAVNQIELHPEFQQREITAFGREHGIATEAWSPLAQGALLKEPNVQEIAEAHGKSLAQVILRWHIQQGNIIFPKSNNRERIEENFNIFDFELSDDEQASITALEKDGRVGGHPDEVN